MSVFAALILFAGWSAVEHDCRHHDHNNCPICVFGANPAEETQITVWVVTPSQAYLEPVYVLPDPESVFPSAFLPRAPPAY